MRKPMVLLAVGALIICGLFISNEVRKPDLSSIEVTSDERAMASLYTEAPIISKYRINRALPSGTVVRVWVESYVNGQRVNDVASCTLQLDRKSKNLSIIVFRNGREIGIAVGSTEKSKGTFPVVESEHKNGGAGTMSSPHRIETPVALEAYFDGSSVLDSSPTGLGEAMDEFIRKTAAVELLMVDIRRPGR